MRRFIGIETALVCSLALGACNKSGQQTPPPVDAANNSLSTGPAPVAAVEGATSAAVGQMSAATTMTASGFVTAAATSDMFEIAAARIALGRAGNPALKEFARKMIHDHAASTVKLKSILASSGLTVTPPSDLDERRRGLINNLNAASDANFDKLYLDQQVAAHEEAVTLFKGYADHGDTPALKDFAAATLPTIEAHLSMAKSMQAATTH
jgi:putative membrane protein